MNQRRVTRPAHDGRSSVLQDLSYIYDSVGNILAAADAAAQPVRNHANQRIAPVSQYQYDALSASGRENTDAGVQGQQLPLPEEPISADLTFRRDRQQSTADRSHSGVISNARVILMNSSFRSIAHHDIFGQNDLIYRIP